MPTDRNLLPHSGDSLDPDDWESLRTLGHQMIDDMLDHVRHVRSRPVWQRMPDGIRASVRQPLPRLGTDPDVVYDDFRSLILPYGLGTIHPRFWGWVIGSGTFTGALAELLTATMNTNAAGWDSSPVLLEQQVLEWLKQMLELPTGGSSVLVNGCSEANFIGIATGLRKMLGEAYRAHGVVAAARPMIYASTEAHFSVRRAVRLLGLGDASYREVAADGDHRMSPTALRSAITHDRQAGAQPCVIVANAGTVGVGAFDDLEALGRTASDLGLWLHVDGAFGALVAMTTEYRHLVHGMARADSVAFDLHKWLHVPFDVACIYVRDPVAHRAAFAASAPYLSEIPGGPAVQASLFADLGLQQGRSARAIKVWFTMREHGVERLAASISKNIRQARWLADQMKDRASYEVMAPVVGQIICFRCLGAGLDAEQLNELNRRVIQHLQCSGAALPSAHLIRGQVAIRCSITNHRTSQEDLQYFLDTIDGMLPALATEVLRT